MFDFILFAGESDSRLVLTVWLDGEVAACGSRLGLAVWRRAVLRYSDENITEKTHLCVSLGLNLTNFKKTQKIFSEKVRFFN